MSLINFDSENNPPNSNHKSLKFVLGIGALVGVIALGSTLAASINLNSGGPVEFGQGVAQTTACDNDIVLTPFSAFVNSAGEGSFLLSSITLSSIDSSAEGCAGKSFTISSFSDNSPTPIAQIVVAVTSTSPWFTIGDVSGATLDYVSSSTFTITIDTNTESIEASEVSRFTIESGQTTYSVGERGPGGGIVYYVSANFFTSTGSICDTQCKYLEVAPATWQSAGASVADDTSYAWSDNTSADTGQDSVTETLEGFYSYEHANWRIGQGFYNTSVMKVAGAISAAQAEVLAYAGGAAAGQWFIPSMNELNELCKYARGQTTGDPKVACDSTRTLKTGTADDLGGFMANDYWSSSEGSTDGAFALNLTDAYLTNNMKRDPHYVRPIRAF
jgi:hypothetical protein